MQIFKARNRFSSNLSGSVAIKLLTRMKQNSPVLDQSVSRSATILMLKIHLKSFLSQTFSYFSLRSEHQLFFCFLSLWTEYLSKLSETTQLKTSPRVNCIFHYFPTFCGLNTWMNQQIMETVSCSPETNSYCQRIWVWIDIVSWFFQLQFFKLTYLGRFHSGMKSTGRSIEPCSSWTARWRETRCCATKPSRRGNRGTGRGGGGRKQKPQWTRLPTRRRRGWTPTRFTTRFSAPSAPLRWPCLIKMKFTISSTSWPATAETDKLTVFHFMGLSLTRHLTAALGFFSCSV